VPTAGRSRTITDRDRDVFGKELHWEVRMTINLRKNVKARMIDKTDGVSNRNIDILFCLCLPGINAI
jgi:hypothetical protein